jgi:3',5'-nucleoside bisphosphate phosphatase
MNDIYADLHMHTLFSDGKNDTSRLTQIISSQNIEVMSITDHDTILAYSELPTGVNFVTGCELTLQFANRLIHMLAYGFDLGDKILNDYLKEIKEQRIRRAGAIVKQLVSKGLEISLDDVLESSKSEVITRTHIADYLIKNEFVGNNYLAFEKYLSDKVLEGPPAMNVHSVEDGIKMISRSGGFCSLAHPGNHYSQDELYQLIKFGMRGIEVYHPSNGRVATKRHTTFARQYQLKITGGSDYHGRHTGEDYNLAHFGLSKSQFEALGLEIQKSA